MVWQIDLSGKTIVISGGNRGIGQAISEQAAQAGANVAILYHSAKDADQVAEGIATKFNVRVKAYKTDTNDQADMHRLVREINGDLGTVGGVVCCAGIHAETPALEIKREHFDRQMGANVWGVFCLAQAAVALWKETNYKTGRVVFVGSISGIIANKGQQQCLYNASKSALSGLTRSLAMEWAQYGVIVNNVCPGYVDTDMNQVLRDDPEFKKRIESWVMQNRISDPHEQAGPVLFLLSDYASYITATDLVVDGGTTAW